MLRRFPTRWKPRANRHGVRLTPRFDDRTYSCRAGVLPDSSHLHRRGVAPDSGRCHHRVVPFTCDACGRSTFPDQIPPDGGVLRCPGCSHERRFTRLKLLVVTGTVGIGKSTVCARLAGTIPGAVLLDADIFANELVSVASPNEDYESFWRTMLRLAHELAQNRVVVVYFSVMRPEQLLANRDLVDYFDSVQFLCLTCPPEVLRARLTLREPNADPVRFARWVEFNSALAARRECSTYGRRFGRGSRHRSGRSWSSRLDRDPPTRRRAIAAAGLRRSRQASTPCIGTSGTGCNASDHSGAR